MTDTKNNLNALLARLKNKGAKREESKSPSITQQEQSAFNEDNNISNILNQNNNKMDDSSLIVGEKQKSSNNDFFNNNAPSFRPDIKDNRNNRDYRDNRNEVKESIQVNENFRNNFNSDSIVNNSIAIESSIVVDNNLKREFDALKASTDMVNFDLKKSVNAYPNKSDNVGKQNYQIKDSFEIEEIEDFSPNDQGNPYNPYDKNLAKANNFLAYSKPAIQENAKSNLKQEQFDRVEAKNKSNNNFDKEKNNIDFFDEFEEIEEKQKQGNDPSKYKKKDVNDYEYENDNKSIPSHIDKFNNLKNMQKLAQRESIQNIHREIEKKNSRGNMQNEVLEKKQKIASEYQSKLNINNMNVADVDEDSNRNNFFSKNKYSDNTRNEPDEYREKTLELQKQLEIAEKLKRQHEELIKQEEIRKQDEEREKQYKQKKIEEERLRQHQLQQEEEARIKRLEELEREERKKIEEKERLALLERLKKEEEARERIRKLEEDAANRRLEEEEKRRRQELDQKMRDEEERFKQREREMQERLLEEQRKYEAKLKMMENEANRKRQEIEERAAQLDKDLEEKRKQAEIEEALKKQAMQTGVKGKITNKDEFSHNIKIGKNGKALDSSDYNPNGNAEFEVDDIDSLKNEKKNNKKNNQAASKVVNFNNYNSEAIGLMETAEHNNLQGNSDQKDQEKAKNLVQINNINLEVDDDEFDDFEVDTKNVKQKVEEPNQFQKKILSNEAKKAVVPEHTNDLMSALENKTTKQKEKEKEKIEALNKNVNNNEKAEKGFNTKDSKGASNENFLSEKDKEKIKNAEKKPQLQEHNINNNIEYPIKPINNKQEQYFHNLFGSDFPKFFHEKTYTFRRRRQAIISNDYFKSYIMGEKNLVDVFKFISRRYYTVQEDQYNSALLDLKDFYKLFENFFKPNEPEQYVQTLLESKPNPYFAPNMKISNLQSLEHLTKKSYNDSKLFPQLAKFGNFEFFRSCLSDGDSFYRSFMFSLLEEHILRGNSKEIKKLVLDIYKILQDKETIVKEKGAVVENFFKVIYVCLKLVDDKKLSEASNVLIAGFNAPDQSFDIIIVEYVRCIVFLIAEEFNSEIEQKHPEHKKRSTILKEKEKANTSNANESDDINLSLISNSKTEACKYALQLIPMIYNVNLNLTVFEGYINNGSSEIKCFNLSFEALPPSNNEQSTDMTINLLYNINKYDVLYSAEKLPFFNEKEVQNPYFFTKGPQVCNRCKQNEKFITIPFYEITFCMGCAKAYVNILTANRVSFMNKENYHSREFYGRPYQIVVGFYIGDALYTEIFGENILQTILKKINLLCFMCDEIKEKQELLTLKECNCQFCKSCLENAVSESTKKYFVLNKIEKQSFKNSTMRCSCNELLKVDLALEALGVDLTDYKEEAIKRQEVYVQTICLKCTQALKKNPQDQKDPEIDFYSVLPILHAKKSEEDSEISFMPHLICDTCKVKVKDAQPVEENKDAVNVEIGCIICQVTHLVDKKDWDKIFNQSACECSIL